MEQHQNQAYPAIVVSVALVESPDFPAVEYQDLAVCQGTVDSQAYPVIVDLQGTADSQAHQD